MKKFWLLAASLWVLAWTAGAIHTEYDPYIVYGVVEPSGSDRYISEYCLETFGIEQYATNVVGGYACGYIYGLEVSVDDITSKTWNKDMEMVYRFAKKFNFDEPQFLAALSGDYEHCSATLCYYPIDRDNQTTASDKKDRKDDKSDEKKESSGESETRTGTSTDPEKFGKQTDGATTDSKDAKQYRGLESLWNQASFGQVPCTSFEPHQVSAARIQPVIQQSIRASSLRPCNTANHLHLISYMRECSGNGGMVLRQ